MNDSSSNIEIVSIKEFQENFDGYMEKIETLKQSFIIETEDGSTAVMIPCEEDAIEIYTERYNETS
jgi:hypothetical protein